MESKENDILKLFEKFNINVVYENTNTSENEFLPNMAYNIDSNYVQIFDNDKPVQSILYPSDVTYGENEQQLLKQPISITSINQEMAGVVRHNIHCPPTQAIAYTNFHIETSVEVISNRIFVGGLTESIGEEDLFNLFQKYGKIQNARIIRNSNNVSKGYGFVTFIEEASATKIKNLAAQDPKKFLVHNCVVIVRDARRKGITKHITRCAVPNFHVSSSIENSNQGTSQQMYQNGECQSPLPLQSDGSVRNQTGSPQQFLTPPQTPTTVSAPPPLLLPPLPPPSSSTFIPSFGYYQYPYQYQYPYNPYCQINPPPYQIYQYTHFSHQQNYPYNQEDPNIGSYESNYDNRSQQSPIVTIESDDDEDN